MTGDARLERIREGVGKATKAEPLPWEASYTSGDHLWGIRMGRGNTIITGIDAYGNADVTKFLAASAADIPYLLRLLKSALAVVKHSTTVMEYLEKHGSSIVPHLIDTDDNPGEYLRQALSAFHQEAAK